MIAEKVFDRLKVHVAQTRSIMGAKAADAVANCINQLLNDKEFVNMIFAAAPSQNEFLFCLCKRNDLQWNQINAFHMDEYVGIDKNSSQSFANFLNKSLFEKVPFRNKYLINGNTPDIEKECQRYTELLEKYPPDIVCMGIGVNGHIAFNDPHVANFNDPLQVKVVDLDPVCRQQQVDDGCFKNIDDVPINAITLTIPSLLRAHYIYCMVPGAPKAQAVYHTLYSEISEEHPSTILRQHSNAILFLDKESSSEIY